MLSIDFYGSLDERKGSGMAETGRKNQALRELLRRGAEEFRRDNIERAQAMFEKAAEAAPDSAEAHAWLAAAYGRRIDQVWSLPEKLEWLGKMEEEVSAALAIAPDLPLARRMRGAMLLYMPEMMGGDPEAAAAEFR